MAQWLAQATHNRLVVGSNPTGPTNCTQKSSRTGIAPEYDWSKVLSPLAGIVKSKKWVPLIINLLRGGPVLDMIVWSAYFTV